MLGKLIKHEFLPIFTSDSYSFAGCLSDWTIYVSGDGHDGPAKCDIDCLICIPDLHLDRCTMCDIYFNCSTLL